MISMAGNGARSILIGLATALLAFWAAGCSGASPQADNGNGASPMSGAQTASLQQQPIARYTGEPSKTLSFVYTAKKELSLTFDGLGDRETIERLLDELDKHHIKATFFVPGMRAAEEPDLVKELTSRGHEVENNTLTRADLTTLSYEEIYKEINRTNGLIADATGKQPQFVRTRGARMSEDVRLVAAQTGLKAVVSYNINPKDSDMQSAKEIGDYIRRYISRGGIIALNTDVNPEVVSSISYIADAAKEVGYKLVPLAKLVRDGGERKPLEQIPGYDAARINPDYEQADYNLIYNASDIAKWNPHGKKVVALTFDDWGSDLTVTRLLKILEDHDVKATFFLRANGVENNPNLARAIVEEGHLVANHTYSHPVITQIPPDELQEEVVKAHRIITEAIQQQPAMLFRPPTGEINKETAKVIAATGYKTLALYDVTTLDWNSDHDAQYILNGVLKQTTNGSVILLHMLDGLHTLEALPKVIDQLKQRGYSFVLLDELYGMK